jgi:predicted nucleic acid-binding protein
VIVIDCSAVVDALSGVAGADPLRELMADEDLHAPALIDYEVVPALRGLLRRGALSAARARDVLTDYESLSLARWGADDALRRRALQLRDTMTAHDAAYVCLAEALECRLITRDARLTRSSGHAARIEVR